MLCVPSVMILAVIIESIPWCHLVVGILFMGSWTRDSPYLPHIDSVASSFRILVTFAIVLEVRGTSFFQLSWAILGRSSFEPKGHDKVLLMSSPFYVVTLPTLPLCMGYLEETCWTWFDILIYASTTQKDICPLELSLFISIPTIVYQLIVRSNCASVLSMLIILVVRQAILFQND